MFLERRKTARSTLSRIAQFYSEFSPMPRPCMVTDISDGGARLYSETDMPPTFTLTLLRDGANMRRECRVVWRLGGELGVEFIDRARR